MLTRVPVSTSALRKVLKFFTWWTIWKTHPGRATQVPQSTAFQIRRCHFGDPLHSPTLLILMTILMGLMSIVMAIVWRVNRRVPGMGWWILAHALGFLGCLEVLSRGRLPDVVSVALAQGCLLAMGYFIYVGARRHVGLNHPPHWIGALMIAVVTSVAVFFTQVHPDFAARFLIHSLALGVLFVLTAQVVARGGSRDHPARYVLAGASLLHGLFMLTRPWLFTFDVDGPLTLARMATMSPYILLESAVAFNVMAFCVLLLVAEHSTGELRRLVDRDELTGVHSRRAFLHRLQQLCEGGVDRAALPILVVDLDHFKRINDTWGHSAGDEALRHFVEIAQRCLRVQDTMGRLGGEEFAVLLPRASAEQAHGVAERLRRLLCEHPLRLTDANVALTASIGVTMMRPGESPELALGRADQAMYQAKSEGRNRVVAMLGPVVSGVRVA
jgi:diguanylate cyclase (GGDEF)-like protein